MKQQTIEAVRKDLYIEKRKLENRPVNKDFTYEIEYIPILTERNKQGKLQQITNCNSRMIFENEN